MSSTYCTRGDIENVFGRVNVAKWADLDNNGVVEDIELRINKAILWASGEVNSRLRRFVYVLPFETAPVEIVDIVANLAGVWLYENRGIQDFNPDTGQAVHRLEWNRRRAETTLKEILMGNRILDAARTVENEAPAGENENDQD